MPRRTTHDDGRRPVVEPAVGQRGRTAKLVHDVVFALVVFRQPQLAVARKGIEVLVLDREIEEDITQRTAVTRVKLGLGATLGAPSRVMLLGAVCSSASTSAN